MNEKIHIEENKLTIEQFINLRKHGPFKEYLKEDIEIALENTIYSVVVFYENKEIGMARIIGDKRIVFFIKDVVVVDSFKKKNIGKIIMQSIFKYIENHACLDAYIALMATPNTESFYEKFGFIRRPNEVHGSGMIMFYKGGKIYEENSSVR